MIEPSGELINAVAHQLGIEYDDTDNEDALRWEPYVEMARRILTVVAENCSIKTVVRKECWMRGIGCSPTGRKRRMGKYERSPKVSYHIPHPPPKSE